MRKLRQKDVKELTQVHTANKLQSFWDQALWLEPLLTISFYNLLFHQLFVLDEWINNASFIHSSNTYVLRLSLC